MKNYLVVLASLFCTLFSYSQLQPQIDSLKTELKEINIDSTKVSLLIQIAEEYLNKNNDSALFYHTEAVNVAEQIGDMALKSKATKAISLFYYDMYKYKEAITNFKETEAVLQSLGKDDELGFIQNYIGYCYTSLYAEDKAIEYFLKSISSFNRTGNRDGIGMNQIDIGNLYYGQENYDFAKKYFNEALVIYTDLDDELGIETCYINLGNATADAGDCKGGLEFYQKAMEIALKNEDEYGIAVNYNNMGDCHITLKQYDKAEAYFRKAQNLAKNINDHELDAIILLNMADVKHKKQEYTNSLRFAEESLAISKKYGLVDFEIDNLDIITKCYESLGDDKNALKSHRLFKSKRDSIIKTDMNKKVQLFQALNDLESNDFIIKQLSAQNEIAQIQYENEKKITFFLVIGLVVFAVMILFMIAQQTSKRKAYNLLEFKNKQINKMNDEIEEQRDNLKSLNETKDQFFSIIAHDLKNPLNSINGFTELMIENNMIYDEKKRLKFLKIIKDSTGSVSTLLDNLLIWANNQTGKIDFKPEKLKVMNLVVDTISLFEAQALNKDIQLISTVEEQLEIKADKNMFDTILRNIVSNAIKFSNPGGKVIIGANASNGEICTTVSDDGVGMSKEILDKLFDINNKTTSVGTKNERGSGLGLILCKDFVSRHGGTLQVDSEQNKGTTVSFSLPA